MAIRRRLSVPTFLAALVCVTGSPAVCRGGELEDADFSLRLPAALTRFASYGDVAGAGGASAASKWASSINPASVAWLQIPSRLHMSLSPQYSAICFDDGPTMHVTTQSLTWDAKEWGTFQPTLTQVRSSSRTDRQGLDFGLDMDFAQMQWGKRLSPDFAIGGAFNVATSRTESSFGPFDIGRSRSESYDFRAGALGRVHEKLLAGVVVDYGFSPGRTTIFDFTGSGAGDLHEHDTTHQFLLRPGLSYEYAKDSLAYFDYQFGSFMNDQGDLEVNRFYLGVDHRIFEWLFVRAVFALDTSGNPAGTAGIGIYPTKWFTIDFAYQYNMFPELEPEFGPSQTFALSLGITF